MLGGPRSQGALSHAQEYHTWWLWVWVSSAGVRVTLVRTDVSRETEEVELSGWLPVSEAGTGSSLHKERSRHLCPSETLNPWAWRRASQGKCRLEVTCVEDSQEPPAPGMVPPSWGGSWRQDANIVSCSCTNHENGAGDRAQTAGTLPTARGTTTPWPHTGCHAGQLAMFTPATWGQKGSFTLQRFYTYILFVMSHSQ